MKSLLITICLIFFLNIPCISMTLLVPKTVGLNKNFMNGMEITALAFDFKPIFIITKLPNGNFSFEGWGYDYLSWAAKYFNVTVKYVLANKDGIQKYGIFKELINELESKQADAAPMCFPLSHETFTKISFTQPLYVRPGKFLQPYPYEESRVYTLIRPYTSTVWILFIASTMVYVGFMSLLARLKDYPGRRSSAWDTIYDQFVYVATIITLQGNSISYSVRSYVRIVTTAWLLAMVVIIYAYTGLLTAMLALPKFEPIINTWEELARSSRFRITLFDDGSMVTQLLSSTNGSFKILGDQLRNDPKLFVPDAYQLIENILHHDCVSPAPIVFVNYIANEDLKASGKCRMTTSTKELPVAFLYHFGFAKDSLFVQLYDRYYMPNMESGGFMKFLDKKYFPPLDQCRVDVKQANVLKPISLSNLFGVFVVFSFGIGFSSIAFLFELLSSLTAFFKIQN